ncbi:MAG: stage III sporulation protein AE [Blautia sp.]|nr:stage III sporulation protein AE [Blautia sp.]
MRIKKIQMIFFLCILLSVPVQASNEEQGNRQEQILDSMELEKMQEAVNELLGEETFYVKESIKKALSGEEPFSIQSFWEIGKEFLYQQFLPDKKILVQVILLVLAASLFSNFTGMFGKGDTGEISFYMVYLFLLTILMKSFGQMSHTISFSLEDFVLFMKALMPSYFLAVTAAGGVASAMIFYNMVLAVIYVIQVVLLKLVIPGIHLFVLFQLVNYLHKEDILSKMAEFFKMILEWTLHTCVAVLVGMQVIQNMISPAVDSLKRDVIGKTAAAIPAVGNAIDGVTEVALGTAVLIRNCIGVVGILVLLLLGLPPIIRLGVTTLTYKLLAAVVQPVADKRMTGCLSTIGEGCRLLLRVLLTVELLLLITIAILSVSFISH